MKIRTFGRTWDSPTRTARKISDMPVSVFTNDHWPQVPKEKRIKKRGFFYLKEDFTEPMVFVSSMCIGVDLRMGPISPGIVVGMSDYDFVFGGSVLDNVAYLFNKKKENYISLTFQNNGSDGQNENDCNTEGQQ